MARSGLGTNLCDSGILDLSQEAPFTIPPIQYPPPPDLQSSGEDKEFPLPQRE